MYLRPRSFHRIFCILYPYSVFPSFVLHHSDSVSTSIGLPSPTSFSYDSSSSSKSNPTTIIEDDISVVGSDHATTCHVVVLRHVPTRVVGVAHVDNADARQFGDITHAVVERVEHVLQGVSVEKGRRQHFMHF